MTTAATITANLVLNSGGFKKGLKDAGDATAKFQAKYEQMALRVARSAEEFGVVGDKLMGVGKKMTTFITLPIAGFFALIIKKAMDADTALAKMAKDSVAKLNDQLVELGTKFLPLVIDMIDKLTGALEWFNNAPPGMQTTITMLVAMLALAGPIATFVGAISKIISFVQGLRAAILLLQPSIISLGATLWGALLPILPILLLIAALVLLVYLLWKNWDELGVIMKQLGAIIKWEFETIGDIAEKKAKEIKTTWSQLVFILKTKWKELTTAIGVKITEIKDKFAKMVSDMVFAVVSFVLQIIARFNEVRMWAINTWNAIWSAFQSAFTAISNFASSVFQGIITWINEVIAAVADLIEALTGIELPEELEPGSPTPFEVGLRGISTAMRELSRQSIPELNRAWATPSGVATVGTGRVVNITDNRRFAAGMDARALRLALDDQLQGLTRALETG